MKEIMKLFIIIDIHIAHIELRIVASLNSLIFLTQHKPIISFYLQSSDYLILQ